MKLFIIFLFSFSLLFGAIQDTNSSDVNNTIQKKQTIFLSYENIPEKVFVNQVFSIKVKAIITVSGFDKIKNKILSENGIKIINANENWKWYNDEIFYKTFYLKATDKNATMPQMNFELYKDGNLINSQKFPKLKLNIINLNTDKYFSHVIADSLRVLKSKTTNFDEKNLIVVLEIEAKNSNLKDFKLSWVKRDGIDSKFDNTPIYKIYYYAIIPKYTKNFIFTYFNTKTNSFIKKQIKIVVDSDEVSTQSDLNPKDGTFVIYKNISFGLLFLALLYLLIRRRRLVYFLALILLVIYYFIDTNPFNSIKIPKNTKVQILPTRNSTVFYITPRVLYVQKIMKREDYIKIILPNEKIGWIKEQNASNN
ncbi:MAG: hypothetical protein GXP61_04390 [Epsilonproteobacteria bacterium]|nr:hypothetical protein [Campylobacterota bacterium]